MTKAQEIIKELEEDLDEYARQTADMDLSKVQDARLVFTRLSFYQAQAFKKLFERLDEIEASIKK